MARSPDSIKLAICKGSGTVEARGISRCFYWIAAGSEGVDIVRSTAGREQSSGNVIYSFE